LDHGVCRIHQLGFLVAVNDNTLKQSVSDQDLEVRYSSDKLNMSRIEALARNEAAVQNPTWNSDDRSPLQTWINETEEQEPWRGYLTNSVRGYGVLGT
jgi:primosomal protein N''